MINVVLEHLNSCQMNPKIHAELANFVSPEIGCVANNLLDLVSEFLSYP